MNPYYPPNIQHPKGVDDFDEENDYEPEWNGDKELDDAEFLNS